MSKAINAEFIKESFKRKGIKPAVASTLLGYGRNTITAALSNGRMSDDMFNKIVLLLDVNEEDAMLYAIPEQGVVKQETIKETPGNIISYICDIGKIQTDILRELKELHDDTKTLLTAVNTNIIDTTTELHQTTENVRNFSVATNQNMNKIHNLMKYGGK